MTLEELLKQNIKDESKLSELLTEVNKLTALTDDKVKGYVKEHQPVYDSLVSTAVASHIEKEKAARAEWETVRRNELLKEAMEKIEKENQKSPEMIKIEELQKALDEEKSSKARASLKADLLDTIKKDKLAIEDVEPFLQYGEKAQDVLKKFAEKHQSLIEASVQKQLAEKFGGPTPPGGGHQDDKPVDTAKFLKEQGF